MSPAGGTFDTVRILVTNDDGISSEGLYVLASAMTAHGDVAVVAPDSEYSGAGAAIGPLHLMDPEVHKVRFEGIEDAWAVSGAPALCVMFARLGAFGPVDLVVSGINPGANVGRSVYHSGTVGAVLTGRNGSIPGLAVSQTVDGFGVEGQGWEEAIADQKWHSAAEVASAVVGGLLADDHDTAWAVNLNVPNLEVTDMKGWRYTEIGTLPPRSITSVNLEPHPDNADAFRVAMNWGDAVDMPVEVDTGAVMGGYVSVSFLSRITAQPPVPESKLAAGLDGLF
ncbi:5'/3'-nucleotidase SurE [Candidatus Poriferisodalis sp.]|uniref:5'/3'-nucleotidase SurE n=1 Tax=Candidatus Poriferisodalis sp. TaxID=3101277 RepID=UPI003AF73B46